VIGPSRRETGILVRAWLLTEGDQALGGETIVALYRDALRHRVTVAWNTGERAELEGDSWVVITHRAVGAGRGVVALRSRYASIPLPQPPLTPRDRYDARRRLDEWRGERRT
jgi:hypothetical protein